MLLEYVCAVIAGIIIGTITGLLPGIHTNLVSGLILAASPLLLLHFSPLIVSIVIVSMFITHIFVDFVPTIFLGAPDSDTVLSVLPGHRFLLQGKGYEAVRLSVLGALFGVIFGIILFPALLYFVPIIYSASKKYIGMLLICLSAYMIFRENSKNKKFFAGFVFMLSGIFGLAVFSMNLKEPLLPMLSGLFGISALVLSVSQKVNIPVQNTTQCLAITKKQYFKTVSIGVFAGSLVSIFPAVGPSQASIIGMQFIKKIEQHMYLVLVGATNTVNMLLSLITLYTINKARNGAIVVVSKLILIDLKTIILLAACVLLSSFAAYFIALFAARFFAKFVNLINYEKLCIAVIVFVTLLVIALSGPSGFFIMVVGASIGIIPSLTGIAKNNLMGCLLLPVIIYFL